VTDSPTAAPHATPGNQPGADYFAVMADAAAGHWWYVARRALFRDLLTGRVPAGGTVLDIGCGTGETMALLRELGAARVAGTDLSDHALAHARSRGGPVAAALAEALPFPSACADVLVSADVIEHVDDDRVALREYRRVLRPGGTLLVTVPSYAWLWCEHDDRAGHRRRYRLTELRDAVHGGGFRVERSSYYFSFLVPPAAALRRTPLRRLTSGTDEEASGGALAGRVLGGLATAERRFLRHRTVPFGLSQMVLATAV
jgi:ubiquinone/menaquinone biosynthesis C-methylase UbiE